MIIVTQLPFVATLVISFMNWNALYPDDRGLRRARQLQDGVHRPDLRDVDLHHDPAHRRPWCWSAWCSGWALALLLDRKFRGRGLVRTMLIAPFLIVPVAAALLWKHALYNPEYGLLNGTLTWVWKLFGCDSPPQPDWITDTPHAGDRWSR